MGTCFHPSVFVRLLRVALDLIELEREGTGADTVGGDSDPIGDKGDWVMVSREDNVDQWSEIGGEVGTTFVSS